MSVAVFFDIAARLATLSPRRCRTSVSFMSARAAAIRVAISASLCRVTWNPERLLPKAFLSRAYATDSLYASVAMATQLPAIKSRSVAKFIMIGTKPVFSSPSRLATGTRQSSNDSSAVSEAHHPIF